MVGVRDEGLTLIGPWGYLNRQLPLIEPPVGPVRAIFGSERHLYAIA